MPQSPHFGAVPRFLMCRRRSLPPGVLITRVRFEDVFQLWETQVSSLRIIISQAAGQSNFRHQKRRHHLHTHFGGGR